MGLKSPKLAPRSLEADEEREERNQGNEMPFASKKKLYNAKEQNVQTLFSCNESKQAKTIIKLRSKTRVTIKYCNRYLCRSNYRTKTHIKPCMIPTTVLDLRFEMGVTPERRRAAAEMWPSMRCFIRIFKHKKSAYSSS